MPIMGLREYPEAFTYCSRIPIIRMKIPLQPLQGASVAKDIVPEVVKTISLISFKLKNKLIKSFWKIM